MSARGYPLPEDNRTAIDAGDLIITTDEDSGTVQKPKRRWARATATVLAVAAACAAGAAYYLHFRF
jgi:hypothetical protein